MCPVPKSVLVDGQIRVSIQKRKMNLTFGISNDKSRSNDKSSANVKMRGGGGVPHRQSLVGRKCIPVTLRQIKGIGPKSVAALAAVSVTSVAQLKKKVEAHGEEWLRENLPFGVKWREVSRMII